MGGQLNVFFCNYLRLVGCVSVEEMHNIWQRFQTYSKFQCTDTKVQHCIICRGKNVEAIFPPLLTSPKLDHYYSPKNKYLHPLCRVSGNSHRRF